MLYYTAYRAAGFKGVIALAGLAIALASFVLAWFCFARYRWSIALATLCLLVLFASPHFLARPHVLAFPVMVLWVVELANATDARRLPRWWMLPLMVLWANLHGGFTLGLLLAAIFALETLVNAAPDERAVLFRQQLVYYGLMALAPLINPYGYETFLITGRILSLSAALKDLTEWQSPDFHRTPYHLIILMLLLALSLHAGLRIRALRLLALLLLVYLALSYNRSLATLGLLLPVIVATPVTRQFPRLAAQTGGANDRPDPIFALLAHRTMALYCIAAVGLIIGALAFARLPAFDGNGARFPHGAVQFAKTNRITGNVLNDYVHGGYLVFHGIPTGIDGRAELFGNDFYMRYGRAMTRPDAGDPFGFLEELDITWTLLRPGTGLIPLLERSGNWRCIYDDNAGVIHLRTDVEENAAISGGCGSSGS